jgi:hypothetical protein
MTATPPNLRTSKAEALAAKEAFQRKFAEQRDDRAVGIGLNRSRDDWAVKVYARTTKASRDLPTQFNGYEVDVQVVGNVSAR